MIQVISMVANPGYNTVQPGILSTLSGIIVIFILENHVEGGVSASVHLEFGGTHRTHGVG